MPNPPVELHVVSDATGETAARLVQALEAQFPEQEFVEIRHPRVESQDDLQLAVNRMRGRPGEVSKVEVRLGDQVMTLAVKNGRTTAEICRQVRGVVLSRQAVPVQQWASVLASGLLSHAESSAQAAEALRRLVTGS